MNKKYSTMEKTTALSSSSSSVVTLFRSCHQTAKNQFINYNKCSLRLKVINVSLSVEKLKQTVDIGGDGGDFKEETQIRGIEVPRQRYIPISKYDLLDSLLLLFESQLHKDQFLLFSSCLDSIIHAEHKRILENMRLDYHQQPPPHDFFSDENNKTLKDNSNKDDREKETQHINDIVEQKPTPTNPLFSTLDLRNLLDSLPENGNKCSGSRHSRVAVATRFQSEFVQLLSNAQFEELSARDLILTSALNNDYLLTLPINVDWKKASDSNAIIFRRGYATEMQKGLLIAEKLDYLQSRILQELLFLISKPLGKLGLWISEAVKISGQGQDLENWTERVKLWLKELSFSEEWESYSEKAPSNDIENDHILDRDPDIWQAAQKAVSRYEGILSPIGPRGRLLRKLLMWIGLVPPISKKPFDLESDSTASEPYLRPIFLSRLTLADIWESATWKRCGNNIWKMLKTATSILSSSSILQEPAFEELILLFTEDTAEICPLQLKVYKNIPIPELPVIFPHRKLSFRILDTVRLDISTLAGLLAFLINYKFENILSSPSALMLDVITTSALIIYVSRVALGYKQTWDRYQLLVNKTLYEKTMASGFGSVHFLLDASEQQQYKEAILTYAILLNAKTSQVTCPKIVKDKCERFIYNTFKEKVDMPIDTAMETLKRLDLIKERVVDHHKVNLQVVPCSEAYHILQQRWNSFLS